MVGGWRLVAVGGGWRLAIDGPLGRSLRAVFNEKKKWFLKDPCSSTSPPNGVGVMPP